MVSGMGCIVCATRGGAGSRMAQLKAINYAKIRKKQLIFLYVVDISSESDKEEGLRLAVRDELYWLGRTLLRIAQKRAEQAAISSQVVIREGLVNDEIVDFLDKQSADLLILGAPRGTTPTRFGDDSVELFAQSIQNQSGVEVEIVRPESEGP